MRVIGPTTLSAVSPTYSKPTDCVIGDSRTVARAPAAAAEAVEGNGRGRRHCARFSLQHPIVSLPGIFEVGRYRRLAQSSAGAFQQNRRSRGSQPEQDPVLPSLGQQPGEGQSDPQTKAVEAIEQLAEEAVSGKRPQFCQRVPGAV